MNEQATRLYDRITIAAIQHGQDDDPDHEVGDLQEALSICLELMTPDQLAQLEAKLEQK